MLVLPCPVVNASPLLPPSPRDLLERALKDDRPDRLPGWAASGLSPQDWSRPVARDRVIDVVELADQVVRLLRIPSSSLAVSRPSPHPASHRIAQRRARTAFERPHPLAQVLQRAAQRDSRWGDLAQQGLITGLLPGSAWSWGWAWSLPDERLESLWRRDGTPTRTPGWLDTDGYSPWEALVQPQAWKRQRADRLAVTLDPSHPAFAGGLIAAWRANNLDAQRWWLDHHSAAEASDEIDAWRTRRGPAAQGTHHAVALERRLLGETVNAHAGERGRRRL